MSVRFDFSGKAVLVTGGTQGIGLAIARAFADAGAEVRITGTRPAAADYPDDLRGFGYAQVRLDDPAERAALAEGVERLDVLVNNAGQASDDEYDLRGFENTLEVNLTAVADLCFRLHDRLRASRGAIVNIGSTAGFIAIGRKPAYTASKAGLLGFTRAIADQWARDGIRANVVAPGFVETRMTSAARNDERVSEALLRAIPARRFGVPAEIASAALFFASEQASYVTGQSLVVDGGLMLR